MAERKIQFPCARLEEHDQVPPVVDPSSLDVTGGGALLGSRVLPSAHRYGGLYIKFHATGLKAVYN